MPSHASQSSDPQVQDLRQGGHRRGSASGLCYPPGSPSCERKTKSLTSRSRRLSSRLSSSDSTRGLSSTPVSGTSSYWRTPITLGAFQKHKHMLYQGDIEFAIYALSSYDRDLISDAIVQTHHDGRPGTVLRTLLRPHLQSRSRARMPRAFFTSSTQL
jgi:hypothetical protein